MLPGKLTIKQKHCKTTIYKYKVFTLLTYLLMSGGVLNDFQLFRFLNLISLGKKEMDFPWTKCNFHLSGNRPAFIQLH